MVLATTHREKGISLMVQRREVVLVCDLCESEDLVQTHRIIVDGQARDAEACDPCWSRTLVAFAAWATQGRTPSRKKSVAKDVVAWPDTEWKFTSHAMQRMGERKVKPRDVIRCVDMPDVCRPGKASDQEIWTRGTTKVVVVPERMVILTVAKTDEEDATVLVAV